MAKVIAALTVVLSVMLMATEGKAEKKLCLYNEYFPDFKEDQYNSFGMAEGPIKDCKKGDTIHFKIWDIKDKDFSSLSRPFRRSYFVRRYCDLSKEIFDENIRTLIGLEYHLVCSYEWKRAIIVKGKKEGLKLGKDFDVDENMYYDPKWIKKMEKEKKEEQKQKK
jgi:hypothetical protein